MASVTQQIPNYIFGISEQPDELKSPGQVRDCVNALPDVTRGLVKRPGTETIATLTGGTTDSKTHWFHIYRDENEQYIGKVTKEGEVYVWNNKGEVKADGLSSPYLAHDDSEDIQVLSVNDYTFLTNRTKTVTLSGAASAPRKNQAFITLKQIKPGTQYALDISTPGAGVSHSYNRATNIEILPGWNNEGGGHAWETTASYPGTGACNFAGRQLMQSDLSWSSASGNRRVNVWWEIDSKCVPGQEPYEIPGVPIPPDPEDYGGIEEAPDDGQMYARRSEDWVPFTIPPPPTSFGADGTDVIYVEKPETKADYELTPGTPINYYDVYTDTAILKFGGEGQQVGSIHYQEMNNSKDKGGWRIRVTAVEPVTAIADLCWVRPSPTPFEGVSATADSILGGVMEQIKQSGKFSVVKQIGNGIYLERSSRFVVTSPDETLFEIIQNSAEDISKIPTTCRDGYIVKIANSGEEADDYYLKFIGDNGDGTGVWEETIAPSTQFQFNASTMPHQLVRQSDGNFTLTTSSWDNRLVGDTETNPDPSFVGKTINKVIFFRNRLGFLSDENVILSRAGDFFNFWAKTATTIVPIDPIDISCSSQQPAILYEAVEMSPGLILFAENQQFILTTDNDAFTATTAKINAMATYRYNPVTHPVSLGTSLVFLNNGGDFTRVFEMTNLNRDSEPTVVEQSKLISKQIENDYNLIAESKENSFMALAKPGSTQIWVYRYFNSGEKRIQSAWVRWILPEKLVYHCIMGDKYYAVDENDVLYGIGIKPNDDIYAVRTVYLDNQVTIPVEDMTYEGGRTTFKCPELFTKRKNVRAFKYEGYMPRYADAVFNDDTISVSGDWTSEPFTLGKGYKMSVEFPTVYPQKKQGDQVRSDIRSSLVIHRVKLNLEDTNIYKTILKRKGKADYEFLHESTDQDGYRADATPYLKDVDKTIAVYERNTNYNLTLESEYPCACTLLSMNWEGDYNPKYYKSV